MVSPAHRQRLAAWFRVLSAALPSALSVACGSDFTQVLLEASGSPPRTPSPLLPSSVPDDYAPLSEDDVVTTRSMTLVASFLTWYADRVLKREAAEQPAG